MFAGGVVPDGVVTPLVFAGGGGLVAGAAIPGFVEAGCEGVWVVPVALPATPPVAGVAVPPVQDHN